MVQSAKRHLPVEKAQRLGFAREAKIKGLIERFLSWYVTAEGPYLRLARGISKSQRLTTDGSNFMDSKEQMFDARKEVETTPNELEVFTEVRETRLLTEHNAGVGPCGDPAGTDVVLQGAEAATSAQVRLKRTSKTYETLTQVGVDAEERTKITFHPDDVSQLVVSMEGSDLIFAKPDDHRDKSGVLLGDVDGHLELDPAPEELDRGEKNIPHTLDVPFLSSDLASRRPNLELT